MKNEKKSKKKKRKRTQSWFVIIGSVFSGLLFLFGVFAAISGNLAGFWKKDKNTTGNAVLIENGNTVLSHTNTLITTFSTELSDLNTTYNKPFPVASDGNPLPTNNVDINKYLSAFNKSFSKIRGQNSNQTLTIVHKTYSPNQYVGKMVDYEWTNLSSLSSKMVNSYNDYYYAVKALQADTTSQEKLTLAEKANTDYIKVANQFNAGILQYAKVNEALKVKYNATLQRIVADKDNVRLGKLGNSVSSGANSEPANIYLTNQQMDGLIQIEKTAYQDLVKK
ncbi:hypothetical protein ACFO26_01135 [Lactococcus nasutitermitis]|uniref:Uncharacterized protein n=1 Tax=Lactococcus nasutitermitis TaxID=1652957 RepID=A0ABV9J9Y0_9LACT|nr:hypothetical protein [Lactococcus nasutitermitis]